MGAQPIGPDEGLDELHPDLLGIEAAAEHEPRQCEVEERRAPADAAPDDLGQRVQAEQREHDADQGEREGHRRRQRHDQQQPMSRPVQHGFSPPSR